VARAGAATSSLAILNAGEEEAVVFLGWQRA
jgi:hypothetical protein